MLGSYLVSIGWLPHVLSYSPSLLAAIAALLVVITVAKHGFWYIRPVYWILIILIGCHLLFGVIANHVQPGSVIVGGRLYLRSIPFFFLALAMAAKPQDLRHQYLAIIILSAVQLPIAAVQRYRSIADGWVSGDRTYGTLMDSGVLSIFLICVSSVAVVLYLRNKLSLGRTICLLAILLVPTMINETKVTLFLIPIAFLIPAFTAPSENRTKQAISTLVLMSLTLAVFIPTYDYFIKPKWGYGLVDFMTMEGRLDWYLSRGAEVGSRDEIGRVDSITLPIKTLKRDPVESILGLGMGSVTESGLGPQYAGQHYSRYGHLLGPTMSRLLWEIGWLGVVLIFALMFSIFLDALKLRDRDDALGVLAHAWIAILPIMTLSLFYAPLMKQPILGALFWYYSGLIVVAASARQN